MKKQEKYDVVAELTDHLTKSKCFYITDTSGLSANKTNELRRIMFKGGVKMTVAKNTLIRKALESTGVDFGSMYGSLKGSSSILFTEDFKTPAKIIKDFRKGNNIPALKAAYVENEVFIGDNQLDTLIALKTKDELIGDIIALLQSPAKNVISALKSSGGKLAGIVKTLSENPSKKEI
jgi:large subunit ribosomal protein L10